MREAAKGRSMGHRNALLLAALLLSLTAGPLLPASRAHGPGPLLAYPGQTGLGFEANVGQFDRHVRYVLRSGNTDLLLTGQGAYVVFRDPAGKKSAVEMKFAGASPDTRVEGEEKLTAVTNYLVGPDPARWVTGAPHYAKVRYHGVYPGVDLIFRREGERLEYDWLAAPGARLDLVRLAFEGADSVEVDAGGALVVRKGAFELRHRRASACQEVRGVRKPVEVTHRLLGRFEAGLEIATYDPRNALVIDPVLEYATVFGGSGIVRDVIGNYLFDTVNGMTVDRQGNVYLAGLSRSVDFSPFTKSFGADTTGGFAAKLNPQGAVVYVTLISLYSGAEAIAVDDDGCAYLVGGALLAGIPVPLTSLLLAPQATGGVFIGKLNPSGSAFVYATLVGGDDSTGRAIAVDRDGAAYVTGLTNSTSFPTTPGAVQTRPGSQWSNGDAFLIKLRRDARALLYSTYLGGSNYDGGTAIVLDGDGSVVVAGRTSSTDFPVTPGAFQIACGPYAESLSCGGGFVAKLNPAGTALDYSTYLHSLQVAGIALDSSGHAYVIGDTSRRDFPTTPDAFQATGRFSLPLPSKAVVLKLDQRAGLVYSTFLGGSNTEFGGGIAVDPAGNAYVAGRTNSPDFPLVRPLQAAYVGEKCFYNGPTVPCFDAFLAKLNPDGSGVDYSTYFGGSRDEHVAGIALNGPDVYLAGTSRSTDLPATSRTPKGGLMVVRISERADAPVFTEASTTNAASFVSGLTPGGAATIFGANLSVASGILAAHSLPLPTSLNGTSVAVNGILAPLLAIADVDGREQINFVVPWTIAGEQEATVQVVNNGLASLPVRVPVLPAQPGMFLIDGVHAAALHGMGYSLVGAELPARRGEVVLLYATGLGAVDPPVADGAPAPADPPSRTLTLPEVVIGGIPAEVQFSGLAPGYAGLYQLNVLVPAGVAAGDADVVITISGQASNAAKLPVQ
ncbi:MAG: SBBP repeat-containing protein [Bryobacteraceae bacterium]